MRARAPRTGEIAVYAAGESRRAHRVLAVAGRTLIVRGDHPAQPLERLSVERLTGTWVHDRSWRHPALGRAPGRVIGSLALLAARPGRLARLRLLARLVPPARVERVSLGLARDPATLAVTLAELGLRSGGRSVDEVLAAYITGEGFAVLATLPSRRAVGALRARPLNEGLRVDVALRRRYRGQGLGGRLLAEAIAEARRRGAEWLLADIRRDNAASLRLFRGAGFEKVAEEVLVSPADGVRFDRYALGL